MFGQRMWSRWVLFIACCIGSGLGVVAQAQSVSEAPRPEVPPEVQQRMARIKGLTMLLEQTEVKIDRTKQVIADMEGSLDLLGQRLQDDNVSEISYSEILMQLQVQRINLRIEKAGLDAKSEKLLEWVGNPPEGASAEKTLLKRRKLEELLDLERQGLDRATALHNQGTVSANELLDFRKRVLQVELQLLELETPSQPQSPAAVWAGEMLSKVALDRIEIDAKLMQVEKLLSPLQHLRPQLSAMQSTKKELDAWHDELSKLKARQMELQNTLSEMQSFPNQPTPSDH